jgi:cell division protein FtsQ
VGGQTILLGSVQDFETKLDNLMLVYKKVFSKAGWAMYDTVSLKFKNQVVCTRKKK